MREYPRTHLVYPFGTVLHYTDAQSRVSPDEMAQALRGWLDTQGVSNVTVEPTPATIEDVFIDRMGAPEEAPRVNAA